MAFCKSTTFVLVPNVEFDHELIEQLFNTPAVESPSKIWNVEFMNLVNAALEPTPIILRCTKVLELFFAQRSSMLKTVTVFVAIVNQQTRSSAPTTRVDAEIQYVAVLKCDLKALTLDVFDFSDVDMAGIVRYQFEGHSLHLYSRFNGQLVLTCTVQEIGLKMSQNFYTASSKEATLLVMEE